MPAWVAYLIREYDPQDFTDALADHLNRVDHIGTWKGSLHVDFSVAPDGAYVALVRRVDVELG